MLFSGDILLWHLKVSEFRKKCWSESEVQFENTFIEKSILEQIYIER